MPTEKSPRVPVSSDQVHAHDSCNETALIASYEAQIASFKAREMAYKKQIISLAAEREELTKFKRDTQVHMYLLDMRHNVLNPIDIGRKIHFHLQESLPQFVSIMQAGKDHKYLNSEDLETITEALHKFYFEFDHIYARHIIQKTVCPKLKCPMLGSVFIDPVSTADGVTYERTYIETFFARKLHPREVRFKSPKTNLPLQTHDLTPNHAVKQQVQEKLQVQYNLLRKAHTFTIIFKKTWLEYNIPRMIESHKRNAPTRNLHPPDKDESD